MFSFFFIFNRPIVRLATLAALLVFAYPPFPFGFLAWVIPAFVLLTLDGRSVRETFRLSWWFGFCLHVGLLYWTGYVTIPGMLGAAAILGVYCALVFSAWAFLRRYLGRAAIWLWPVLWVAQEYLRGVGVLGFPWTNLSYSQTHYIHLIQFASITGDLGVSLWVGYLNVIWFAIRRNPGRTHRQLTFAGVGLLLLILPILHGKGEVTRLDAETTPLLTATVLQGDIDSWHKWDSLYTSFSYSTYYGLAYLAKAQSPELIVWPETAAPGYLRADIRRLRQVQALSRRVSTPMLIGTLEYRVVAPGQYIYYNAAHQLREGRLGPKYHAKLQLVPMGEWIPFSDRVKILKDIHVGQADFTAGSEYVLFDHPKGPYAALICFESVFPDLVRKFVLKGATFLVNITNDGWYGFTPGAYQHAGMCVMRAIENRVPVIRSANSGISMFVDRAGRIIDDSNLYFTDLRTATVAVGKGTTFFVRHGMWLGQFCTLLTGLLLSGVMILILSRRLVRVFRIKIEDNRKH